MPTHRPPRLAFVSLMDGSPWGGSEELWLAAATAALEAGHPVAASVARWPEDPPKLRDLRARGARILRRHGWPRGLRRLGDEHVRRLAVFRPDVVCVNQGGRFDLAHGRSGRALSSWLARADAPYVLLCHGQSGDPKSPDERARLLATFGAAHRVSFPARRLVRECEAQLGAPLPNATVVANPVNLQDLGALAWPSQDTVAFGVVARLDSRKGVDGLLEVLSDAPWTARPWQLEIAGDGPERENLQSLARRCGLDDRVRFHGHVADPRRIWSRCHIALLPSHSEGLPLSVVEAMVCGRPALATDVGGIRDLIEEPTHGFVAAGPERDALAAALERAWLARAHWPAIGAAARDKALRGLASPPGRVLLELLRDATGAASAS